MKRSVCTKCHRKYWAQTTKAVFGKPLVQDGPPPILKTSAVKTTLCKKHAPPTKTYGQSAIWRQAGRVRHVSRRSIRGFEPKKKKEIEDAV